MSKGFVQFLSSIMSLLGSIMLIGCALTTLLHLGLIAVCLYLLAIYLRMVADGME